MTELAKNDNPLINLHEVPQLQYVEVDEHTILRPMRPEDAPEMLDALVKDPTIKARVSVASRMHDTRDVEREVTAYKNDPGMIRYAIVQDGKSLGLISLWRDDAFFGGEPDPYAYGFGYFLHPDARGQGLIGASLQRLMAEATTVLPVTAFIAYCEDTNPDSVRVLERAGFSPTDRTVAEPANVWVERMYRKEVA